ncbi:MAG: hypothetical protein RR434_03295 [Raoultibacter sp.]
MNKHIRPAIIGGGIGLALVAMVIAAILLVPPLLGAPDNEVKINPNVVVYNEESSPFKVLACDSESVTVSSLEGIKGDSILSAGVTATTPKGLLRKIVSAEPVMDGYLIETAPAALTDAIEKCNIVIDAEITPDGDYKIISKNDFAPSIFEAKKAYAGELDNLFSKESSLFSASAGNRVEVSLKIDGSYVNMRMVNHFSAGLSFNPTNNNMERAEVQETLFDKDLRPLVFNVGPVPVVLTNNLDVSLDVRQALSALSLKEEMSVDKSFGFEYTSNVGLRGINEDNSKEPVLSFSAEEEFMRASLDASLIATLGSRLYGLAGPDLSLGLNSKTTLQLKNIPEGEDTSGAIVIPGIDRNLKGSLQEKITVPLSGVFRFEVPNFNNPFSSNDSFELGSKEIFNTGDTLTLLDIDQQFGHISERVETEYFSFDIPESWGSNYTFTQTETGGGSCYSGRWTLTPNDLTPFSPDQKDNSEYGHRNGDYITIGVAQTTGVTGLTNIPNGGKFQECRHMGKVSFVAPILLGAHTEMYVWVAVIYPNKSNVFSLSDGGSPISPSQQQVDDAAYIMSTFVVK